MFPVSEEPAGMYAYKYSLVDDIPGQNFTDAQNTQLRMKK